MRPPLLDADANSPDVPRNWRHWKRCFQSNIQRIKGVTDADKLDILISLLHASVYACIRDCETYGNAITCLDNTFLKPVNEVFTRHRLNICQQKVGELLEEFLQRLKTLSAECNFRAVTAAQNHEAAIRDAFIAGLSSGYIHQRLLEDACAIELEL